jgi:hypothetical protein
MPIPATVQRQRDHRHRREAGILRQHPQAKASLRTFSLSPWRFRGIAQMGGVAPPPIFLDSGATIG